MMTLPLLAGAALTTFAPHAPSFFGSFTNALCNGALPILAVFYVCMGARISISALPQLLKKGGALLGAKIALGVSTSFIFGHLIGIEPVSSGLFAGLSTLAVVAAINDTNGGLYMALMEQYGTPEESAAYSVMSLESGPFLTMLSLGITGLSGFPWQIIVGSALPLAFGMLLGNVDRELRDFLARAVPVLVPFFAFALGCTLDLHQVVRAGMIGLGLGLVVLVISAMVLILADHLVGGDGTAGVAASSTAGNAVAVPTLVAAANPSYAPAAASSTVLVAASVIISSLLVPPLTAFWKSRARRKTNSQTHPPGEAAIHAKNPHSR